MLLVMGVVVAAALVDLVNQVPVLQVVLVEQDYLMPLLEFLLLMVVVVVGQTQLVLDLHLLGVVLMV